MAKRTYVSPETLYTIQRAILEHAGAHPNDTFTVRRLGFPAVESGLGRVTAVHVFRRAESRHPGHIIVARSPEGRNEVVY